MLPDIYKSPSYFHVWHLTFLLIC